MKEEQIEIQAKDFEPKHIFECGQCFRWEKLFDTHYRGVTTYGVLDVEKKCEKIQIKGFGDGNLQEFCNQYFDLETDYSGYKEKLSKVDEYMKESIGFGFGIRILNQDLWEMIISFIISANNNIPRIKGIIERLSQNYGTKMIWKNDTYFLFPTPEQLAKASVEDLRKLGLGFRDKRIFEVTKFVVENPQFLEELRQEKQTSNIKEKLLALSGVGPKVADCIMLFSELDRKDVFPVDVWVRRVMNELYIKQLNENQVSREKIEDLAIKKYGNIRGIAQQYLFYWRREIS